MSWGLICVKIIEGVFDFGELFRTDVGIDLCGCYAGVPQDFLNVPEVNSLLKQMSCKTVSQGMGCGVFINPRLFQCLPENVGNACCAVLSPTLSFK